MKKNTLIRKKFCVFLNLEGKAHILEVKTTDPHAVKLLAPKGRYAFYTMEKLFYTTEDNIELRSKEVNKSKIYFLNAKLVTKEEVDKETQAEAAAEPWTTNDAGNLQKKMNNDPSVRAMQCLITQYFFEYKEKEYILL